MLTISEAEALKYHIARAQARMHRSRNDRIAANYWRAEMYYLVASLHSQECEIHLARKYLYFADLALNRIRVFGRWQKLSLRWERRLLCIAKQVTLAYKDMAALSRYYSVR